MVETLPPVTGNSPVVGLAGFFGYGNFGDELFVSVYKEYLGPHFDLRFMSDNLRPPYYSKPLEEIVDEVDAIVIGGGDIVQGWNLDERYFPRAFLEKPVFVAGVGVPIRSGTNANSQVEKDWIVEKYRAFFNHDSVKMINARDQQSVNWIKKKTSPIVEPVEAPDLVCALTLPPVEKPVGPPILGIVTRKRPKHEDDYKEVNALADQQREKGWLIRHIVLGTGEVGERDVLDATKITGQKELIYSQDMDTLCRAIGECTALVSMKFHGTVVATMYGVPSTVLIATNKNRNFMQRINRKELISSHNEPNLAARFAEGAPAPIAQSDVDMLRRRAKSLLEELVVRIKAEIS